MNIYISSHDRKQAQDVAKALIAAGYTIESTWHDGESVAYEAVDWDAAAESNRQSIRNSDLLVLIAGPDRYPGGKFVEAGIAYAWRIPVFVLGRAENGMIEGLATDYAFDAASLVVLLKGRRRLR